jgi:hypothetical protein
LLGDLGQDLVRLLSAPQERRKLDLLLLESRSALYDLLAKLSGADSNRELDGETLKTSEDLLVLVRSGGVNAKAKQRETIRESRYRYPPFFLALRAACISP